jgi:hypothetical protein
MVKSNGRVWARKQGRVPGGEVGVRGKKEKEREGISLG